MADVYYISARVKKWKYSESLLGKLEKVMDEIGLNKYFEKDEWVAIKTHFGSEGAHRIVRPVFLRKIVDALKKVNAKPFITDTVRIKGLDYLEVANKNGINHLTCNAPVVLADGLYGNDNVLVKAGEILGEIAIASVIYDATAMVVCSHFKGHINAGFGGAIKNLAMGAVSASHRYCGWKCGRGAMHTIGEGKLIWNKEECTLCLQCEEICPLECIDFKENEFTYDDERCWRCGRCTRVCPSNSLVLPGDDELFMRSLAEAAMAVLSTFKKGKVLYINFLTEIQPECDCMPAAEVPILQDKGILISEDIVAIEQASLDLLSGNKPLPGSLAEDMNIIEGDDIFMKLHGKPYIIQIEEAERLGLGERRYNLIRID